MFFSCSERQQLQKALPGFVGEPTKCFPLSEDIWNDCLEITTVDVFFIVWCFHFQLPTDDYIINQLTFVYVMGNNIIKSISVQEGINITKIRK